MIYPRQEQASKFSGPLEPGMAAIYNAEKHGSPHPKNKSKLKMLIINASSSLSPSFLINMLLAEDNTLQTKMIPG